MSLEENSLWNSGVFNSVLNDVDGVIIKIVEDNALSDSEVFIGIFNNWLLEISVEFKNL
jgi:hypothetical protein